MSSEVISVQEAADRLGVSKSRVFQLIRAGRLPATRVGNQYVLPAAAVAGHQPRDTGYHGHLARG